MQISTLVADIVGDGFSEGSNTESVEPDSSDDVMMQNIGFYEEKKVTIYQLW